MTKEQMQQMDDVDLVNRMLADFLYSLEKSQKKTKDYLREIADKEGLYGDVGEEKNREILLKYFNNYQFEDETDAKATLYSFLNQVPILNIKYAKLNNVLRDFNKKYRITATIDKNLVMTIKDEYSYLPLLKDYLDLVENGTLEEMDEFERKYFRDDDIILPGEKNDK